MLFHYNNKIKQRHLIFEDISISKKYEKAPVDHSLTETLEEISRRFFKKQLNRWSRAIWILIQACQ